MDTLSSPIPNLQVPKPFNHHNQLKPTSFSTPTSTSKTTATSSISTLPQKDNFTPTLIPSYTPLTRRHSFTSSVKVTSPPRASVHRRAASGYAAALLDISQGNNTVLKVEKDVRRLLNLVFRSNNEEVREFMKSEFVGEKEKCEVVKKFVEKGKFEDSLVSLVKMLVDKSQSVELVKEVLHEFLRVFHQLTNVAQPPHHTRLAM